MDSMTISELARRTGTTASTLRYYESEGLVQATRGANGYRRYDARAVDRLRFIHAAKGLRLSLAGIRDLLHVWEGGTCRDLKGDLGPLVTERLRAVEQARTELDDLVGNLRAALRHLDELPDRREPCDPECAFLAPAAHVDQTPAVIACSLDGDGMRERLIAWQLLLARGRQTRTADGVEVVLDVEQLGSTAALARAEQRCCPILSFTLELSGDTFTLVPTAPPEGRFMIDDLIAGGAVAR